MKGVAAFLKEIDNNTVQLVFNDVDASSENEETNWNHSALFTRNEYDVKDLKDLTLTEKQFAEIGENIIIRLLALNGHLS